MLRRNLLTALALARRGYRWHQDDYRLIFRVLCLSLPWIATEPQFDFAAIAGTHASAWRASFGGADSRDLGLRLPRPGAEDLGALIDRYAERVADMSEEEHGHLLGQVFGRAGVDDIHQRIPAMVEGLRVVRSLLGRTDVPAAIVARALSWADRAAGIGSRGWATSVEELQMTLNTYRDCLGPRDALALRLALEASREGHPGGDAPFSVDDARRAYTEASRQAYDLLREDRDHHEVEEK
jgi:hypothetical protein